MVKELVSKTDGLCPRGFESRRCRLSFRNRVPLRHRITGRSHAEVNSCSCQVSIFPTHYYSDNYKLPVALEKKTVNRLHIFDGLGSTLSPILAAFPHLKGYLRELQTYRWKDELGEPGLPKEADASLEEMKAMEGGVIFYDALQVFGEEEQELIRMLINERCHQLKIYQPGGKGGKPDDPGKEQGGTSGVDAEEMLQMRGTTCLRQVTRCLIGLLWNFLLRA